MTSAGVARAAGAGLELVEVPAGQGAVLSCEGPHPQTMQRAIACIHAEWLGEVPWALDGYRMFSFRDMREGGSAFC